MIERRKFKLMIRWILIDMKTGEVYSEIQGWNKCEATMAQDWSNIIYRKTRPYSKEKDQWEDRDLRCIPFGMPEEPEIYT